MSACEVELRLQPVDLANSPGDLEGGLLTFKLSVMEAVPNPGSAFRLST